MALLVSVFSNQRERVRESERLWGNLGGRIWGWAGKGEFFFSKRERGNLASGKEKKGVFPGKKMGVYSSGH